MGRGAWPVLLVVVAIVAADDHDCSFRRVEVRQ
jgi:hypothetical protein